MSDQHLGAPGIGGSLGMCALCGDNFLVEVMVGAMLNKKVVPFKYSQCSDTLYAHEKCVEPFRDGKEFDVLTLPDKSPLKQAYLEAVKERKPK